MLDLSPELLGRREKKKTKLGVDRHKLDFLSCSLALLMMPKQNPAQGRQTVGGGRERGFGSPGA